MKKMLFAVLVVLLSALWLPAIHAHSPDLSVFWDTGTQEAGAERQYWLGILPARITPNEKFTLAWFCQGEGQGPATETVINVPAGIVFPDKCDGSSECQLQDEYLACWQTGIQGVGVTGTVTAPGYYTFSGTVTETGTGVVYPLTTTLRVDGGHSGAFAQVLKMNRVETGIELSGTEPKVDAEIKIRDLPLMHQGAYLDQHDWSRMSWKGPNYGLYSEYVEIHRSLPGPSVGEAFTRGVWNWADSYLYQDCRTQGANFRLYSTASENTVIVDGVGNGSAPLVSYDNGISWKEFYVKTSWEERIFTTTQRSGSVLLKDTDIWGEEVQCGSYVWDVEGLYRPTLTGLAEADSVGTKLVITGMDLPALPEDAWLAFRVNNISYAIAPATDWIAGENHQGSFRVSVPTDLVPGREYEVLFGYWWKGGYVTSNNALSYTAEQTYRTYMPFINQ